MADGPVGIETLSLRALNRASCSVSCCSSGSDIPVVGAVEHLVGVQAQLPMNPYVGLWSRIRGFDPEELGRLVLDGSLVRIAVMRATIHLVSADDCCCSAR